ncbi:hypothetical protein GBAR_LOCUS11690 [Geodia barretti]|uniref:ABC transporter substrate-binding protein n=1 Tax=Geodia barretti TaxID=519541 RepID=A0AA35WM20_GEOBA|nr:hypothetical protein GBAR_LOCUS11690 [Geodia barretti]
MRERGIPVRYTLRNINQDRSRIPEIVAEIRAAKPDLVHTFGTSATLGVWDRWAARTRPRMSKGSPACSRSWPIRSRPTSLRASRSTGRPLTGTAFLPPVAKQLDALLEYRSVERLGVVYNSLERNSVINVEELKEAASERGIELLQSPVPLDAEGSTDPNRLPEAVDALVEGGAQFLYIGPDSFVTRNRVAITDYAAERGLPTFAGTEATFEGSRAVLGYVSRYYLVGKLAGAQAERILVGGERPEDIPVASLARFALLIRMPVALELEIYPPLSLLRVAQVVE